MTAPSYPLQLEQWWLDQARKQTGIENIDSCLASLENEVGRLSELFTREREARFGEYAQNDRLLLAYGLFFFPQTFVRVQLVLDELCCGRGLPISSGRPLRILDLGCGSGAATFAALRFLAARAPELAIEAKAVDRSRPFLKWAERLFDANRSLWPAATLRTGEGDLLTLREEESWDLILVSFALNEGMESREEEEAKMWLRHRLASLSDGGVLVILEPVSQSTSGRLEQLRDWVAEHRAARILGPCLHQAPCPLLSSELWCHEVRRWQVPGTVQYLNRHLFRSIEDLKFSYLALEHSEAPEKRTAKAGVFRMIAPMRKLKGKLVTAGCAADGGARTYEMLTRELDRPAEDRLTAFERGTLIRAVDLRPLADGKTFRVRSMEKIGPV